MRFRPEQHLRRPGEIRAVREEGRRVDCRAFTLWWKRRENSPTPAPPNEPSRVCVIASKAAVGGATHRNRAKRRLREVYRHEQNHVPPACDLLLIARAAVNAWPMPELQKKFTDACRQIAAVAATEPK
ncbi:MAG: ribonuclease P protein component [Opitutaceae bacterium]|nr:ribonuclease P protein component [Opitutaceae bacterium]